MTARQKVFAAMGVSTLAVALLFSTPTTARAQTVTNLTSGGTISLATVIDNDLSVLVGDKLFGNFFFSYSDTDGILSDDLTKSNVTITTVSNVIGFGLQFSQPLLALGPVIKDIVFQYSATVTNSPNFISDVHLSITGSNGNGGLGTVGEDVFQGGIGATNIGHLQASTPVASNDVLVANIVPPVTQLWVQKDVIVTGGNAANGFASISVIDQTYSQVPEPSTVILVGLGLVSMVALKRKRSS